MSTKPIRTIAGRWKEHASECGLDQRPRAEQAKAMMQFYSGFSAAIDATMELADLDELAAMQVLASLNAELLTFAKMAEKAFASSSPGAH